MIVKLKRGEKLLILIDDAEFYKIQAVPESKAILIKMGSVDKCNRPLLEVFDDKH